MTETTLDHSEVPRILYKYRNLVDKDEKLLKNTEAIFSRGEIYFAPVDKLNDPCEHFFSLPDRKFFNRTFSLEDRAKYPYTLINGSYFWSYRVSKENRIKVMNLVSDITDIKFFIARPETGQYKLKLEHVTLAELLEKEKRTV